MDVCDSNTLIQGCRHEPAVALSQMWAQSLWWDGDTMWYVPNMVVLLVSP